MRFTLTASPLLILALSATASLVSGQVHLERRNSHEVRSAYDGGNGASAGAMPSYGDGGEDYAYGQGGKRPLMDRPYQRRYPARRRPYGGKSPQSAYTPVDGVKGSAEEDCDEEKDILPTSTTTCTDEFPVPTHVPVYDGSSDDSGVQNSGEQACEAVTVTQTEQVPVPEYITETVTDTVDRPVTMTETVEVTSVQVETTTLVQPVYQTETVTCTETLPPVYETKYETVEHTVYETATETVYPQPTGGVDTSGEQRYPVEEPESAYPETPSAYPEAKASAY